MYAKGLVVVVPAKIDISKPETKLQVIFQFQRNQFKMEPGGSATGMRTIPHYSFLQPANLIAVKKLVVGHIFSTVYRGASEGLQAVRDSFGLLLKTFGKATL